MKPDSIAPRALVIEDNPDVVETVAEMLETMRHTWEGAENVEDAVLKAQGGSFDYILCDLELPRSYGRLPNLSHGLGLIETLAKMPYCEGTPISVMTAHSATAELVEETRRCGARDFVPKPFPTTGHTLQEAIRLALRR
jgi:CheY-like chemotaxis protein